MRIISLVLVSFILLFIFSAEASSQDKVQLGLVGHWNNYYGSFNAVVVMKGEIFGDYGDIGATYAFCATSKGMVVF